MLCMRCKSNMRKVSRNNVLVDRCPDCGSIWLDAGELEMLQKGAGHDKAEILKQARGELLEEARRLVTIARLCPKCERTPLRAVSKKGIELDVCGDCGGIFLDEGELEPLLEKSSGSLVGALLSLIGR